MPASKQFLPQPQLVCMRQAQALLMAWWQVYSLLLPACCFALRDAGMVVLPQVAGVPAMPGKLGSRQEGAMVAGSHQVPCTPH